MVIFDTEIGLMEISEEIISKSWHKLGPSDCKIAFSLLEDFNASYYGKCYSMKELAIFTLSIFNLLQFSIDIINIDCNEGVLSQILKC